MDLDNAMKKEESDLIVQANGGMAEETATGEGEGAPPPASPGGPPPSSGADVSAPV